MRRFWILLTPLLLAGCIKGSASYYIDDASNDHVITVRAEQEYFWKKDITLTLVASHMPECQRVFPMTSMPVDEVSVELFSNGDDIYTVRSGTEVMQVDTLGCALLAEPAPKALGQPVGTFFLDEKTMTFEKATAPPAPATGAAGAGG
ncbi:hypothetical protein CR152_00405 [Massilia violaceinigra]|uniref:Lipoprotein n=1 Tax=Massilia violaceinigra TaxID=2045208 RepID=A0A2D2DDS4_9BURK|nr:hypothetical protein [Massilia violaceinigra]ATQ73138.1 hypothetical protein CR152_00405 [Massilia violaceinigra]